MRVAVLSDVHGNSWALRAVLAELAGLDAHEVVNLGDCLWGPLDPRGTYELLSTRGWPTVRGNCDRRVVDGSEHPETAFTQEEIGEGGIGWNQRACVPTVRLQGVLACHGTPASDEVTLLERIEPGGVRRATEAELAEDLAGVDADVEVVLCGHSHRPDLIALADGRLVVNPGSVGLPAYYEASPHPHHVESGSPHARWALLERGPDGWRVELRATPYDTAPAAEAARQHGRSDWARWIRTGRAGAPSA